MWEKIPRCILQTPQTPHFKAWLQSTHAYCFTTLCQCLVSIAFELQFHGAFQSDNLEKKFHRDSILISFFFLHDKGVTSEILLSKDLIDMRAHTNHFVCVLRPLLFVLVCLQRELYWNFQIFIYLFSKFKPPNWGCGLYMDFYSTIGTF